MSVKTFRSFDLLAIGNAITDIICVVPQSLISELDVVPKLFPGSMRLCSKHEHKLLLGEIEKSLLQPITLCGGGSAANTAWAAQLSGANTVYSGKLNLEDHYGQSFLEDIQKIGIHYGLANPLSNASKDTSRNTSGGASSIPESKKDAATQETASSLILITPDGERTMLTHLGIATELSANDIDIEVLSRSRYVYCEAYLLGVESTRKTCFYVLEKAKQHGVPIAFSYSDPLLAWEYREELLSLTKDYCDIVFANKEEALAVLGEEPGEHARILNSDSSVVHRKLSQCIEHAPQAHFFISNGSAPSYLVGARQVKSCATWKHRKMLGQPHPMEIEAIDCNGAGDSFAGGILAALALGYNAEQAMDWGNYLAGELVQQKGSRLQKRYLIGSLG